MEKKNLGFGLFVFQKKEKHPALINYSYICNILKMDFIFVMEIR